MDTPSHQQQNNFCVERRAEIPAAMASATLVLKIQEEIKCPICLEYLTDPVTIQCGHNFCRSCFTQYWVTWDEPVNGPLIIRFSLALVNMGFSDFLHDHVLLG
uniref:RING-type domain-containing protein n=1 Tax=Pelusios castaneus TaxID=367368 RepID=A0A8C8RWI3_9SAUR